MHIFPRRLFRESGWDKEAPNSLMFTYSGHCSSHTLIVFISKRVTILDRHRCSPSHFLVAIVLIMPLKHL